MRIKVQKHNLDNHQRGYSKMSASVEQEAFQEEHLSTESVRRLLVPPNVQGASIPVSLGCGRLRDPGVSSRSGSSMAQDTASHSGLDRLETSARHHPHELCEGGEEVCDEMRAGRAQSVQRDSPSKSTSPSPFRSTSRRMSSASFRPTWEQKVGGFRPHQRSVTTYPDRLLW